MMTEHDRLRLQDYLDDRLDDASRREVEAALADSAEWRDELDMLTISRDITEMGMEKIQMPDGVKAQIQTAVNEALKQPVPASRPFGTLISFRFQALAAAAMLVVFLGLYFAVPAPAAGPVGTVAQIYQAYETGRQTMQFTPEDPTCIETHMAAMGIAFDPAMIEIEGFKYCGGCITKTDDCDYATFAYWNENKKLVTCQMFRGQLDELPGTYEHRIQRGRDFMVARKDGLTMTFWQAGEMICVLSTGGDEDEAIQIAVNKASHHPVL